MDTQNLQAAYEELVRQWHTARADLSRLTMIDQPSVADQKSIKRIRAWIQHLSSIGEPMRKALVAQGILEPRQI